MDAFYLTLFTKAGTMFAILSPVAFVFIVVGLWTTINGSGRSASNYMKAIARAAILVLVLSQFITWIGLFEDQVESLVYGTLNANPATVYERYKRLLDSTGESAEGFWSSFFRLPHKEIFKALIASMLWSAQFIAKMTVYIAYVVYKLALAYLIATAPFFIGCLAARSTTQTGMAFIFGTVGVLLWPLGWGFASLVTDALLTVLAGAEFTPGGKVGDMKVLLVAGAAGLWIVFSTIAAPLVLQRILTTGAGIGTALLSGGFNAVKSGVQSGSTAGAALALTGVGPLGAGLGAVGAGALAFGSSGFTCSSHSGSGVLFGNLARMGESAFGRGGKSSSGDEGGKSAYQSSDPANDQKATAAIQKKKS